METQGPLSDQTLGGKYLLGKLLGEGGFGGVYRGHHLLLDRPQAIKVLHEHYFRKPEFRERFLREAKIVAALDHPHIVHIDDFGMDEQEAKTYLVMPFIGGGTLSEILKGQREPLPVEQVVLYMEQICSALDYAHQQGVVHLDLKPLNLLIREGGGLLLSDFGLAHFLNQEEIEGGTSLEFGSPHYMAPEHINGQPNRSSDIYALGVILFEMLVGQRPFTGTAPEVMLKHLTKPPPLLRSLRPELPIELEEVLERALAKQAEQRFRSASALLTAFKGALARVQEQVRKVEEERLRKVEEEQARKAEEERLRREKPALPESSTPMQGPQAISLPMPRAQSKPLAPISKPLPQRAGGKGQQQAPTQKQTTDPTTHVSYHAPQLVISRPTSQPTQQRGGQTHPNSAIGAGTSRLATMKPSRRFGRLALVLVSIVALFAIVFVVVSPKTTLTVLQPTVLQPTVTTGECTHPVSLMWPKSSKNQPDIMNILLTTRVSTQITSKPATSQATGIVYFTNASSTSVQIPSQTVLATRNNVTFVTTANALILPQSTNPPLIRVPIQACNPGISGNVSAGSITVIPPESLTNIAQAQYPPVSAENLKTTLTVSNPEATTGGDGQTVTQHDLSYNLLVRARYRST